MNQNIPQCTIKGKHSHLVEGVIFPCEIAEQTNYVHVSRTCCPKCSADGMNGVEHECRPTKKGLPNDNKPKDDWETKFDGYFQFSSGNHNFNDIRHALIDFIRQTRQEAVEEYKKELHKRIEALKIATHEQTEAFKYDACYEECQSLLSQ